MAEASLGQLADGIRPGLPREAYCFLKLTRK